MPPSFSPRPDTPSKAMDEMCLLSSSEFPDTHGRTSLKVFTKDTEIYNKLSGEVPSVETF